jgi:mRNA-degrading endonuclease RelE of RelBE toxin-antitoxin system
MARYKIFVTATAEHDLKKISSTERVRIGRKLRYFAAAEDPLVFAVQLVGIRPPIYRFRVGKYRVFFDIKANSLRILSISLRDKAYR